MMCIDLDRSPAASSGGACAALMSQSRCIMSLNSPVRSTSSASGAGSGVGTGCAGAGCAGAGCGCGGA
eukprot:2843203-Pyramimonas_sp.AAC.1